MCWDKHIATKSEIVDYALKQRANLWNNSQTSAGQKCYNLLLEIYELPSELMSRVIKNKNEILLLLFGIF